MTVGTGAPKPDDKNEKKANARIMTVPVILQNGEMAPVEQVFEIAVSLDHLKRDQPALLTALRMACIEHGGVKGNPEQLGLLNKMGFTTEKGTPLPKAAKIVLATVRGASGAEVVENPFLDTRNRALFDYLRNGALVTMAFDPNEIKAIHENETVIDLMDVADDARWVGYVQNRGGGSPPKKGPQPPSRN